jgi:hypothetical protein
MKHTPRSACTSNGSMHTSVRAPKLTLATILCVAVGSMLWPGVSHAANQEPTGINLGFTSFFDGFGRNEEGFTYLAYAQLGMARSIIGNDGNPDRRFTDPKINAFVLINQLVYVLPEKLFNDMAHVGIDFIVPVVGFDTKFKPLIILHDNGVGLGDVTFGPLLQFRPIIVGGRPVFSQRFELDVIAPTGKYDPDKDINQGSGFTSLNPYWAATVLPLPHLEVSWRLHYLYNFRNDRPALGYLYRLQIPPAVKSAQAGQAGWVNFAASYEVLHGLHVGVNGYYFLQFNLDLFQMRDGSSNPGTFFNDSGKASVLGIGPGAFWEVGDHDKLYANVYFQTLVRNRAESKVVNLHWIHGF